VTFVSGRGSFLLALLLTGGCGSAPFAPFAQCDSCPLPETDPPVGTFLFPQELEFVRATDFLHVTATDDIRVAHVEIFWVGLKVHTGVIATPPFAAQFEGHPGINLGMVKDSAPLYFSALVTDVEGNVDTVEVIARFDRFPFEEGQKAPE